MSNNTTASKAKCFQGEIGLVKVDVKVVEEGMTTWLDAVVTVQSMVAELRASWSVWRELWQPWRKEKGKQNSLCCWAHGIQTPDAFSGLIKEVFQLDRDVRVDRSHCSLTAGKWKPRDKPCTIIAKLHREGDAMDILRRACNSGGKLNYKRSSDYTTSVVKGRAAVSEVRKLHLNRQGSALAYSSPPDSVSPTTTRKRSLRIKLEQRCSIRQSQSTGRSQRNYG